MIPRMTRHAAAAVAVLLALAATSCREGVPPPTAPASGTLIVRLTLGSSVPAGLDLVEIPIVELAALPDGGGTAVVLNGEALLIDLTLVGTGVELLRAELTPDDFEAVGVAFDPAGGTVRETGAASSEPLDITSLAITAPGLFAVENGSTIEVTLEVDAARSLEQLGDGSWVFTPLIRLRLPA